MDDARSMEQGAIRALGQLTGLAIPDDTQLIPPVMPCPKVPNWPELDLIDKANRARSGRRRFQRRTGTSQSERLYYRADTEDPD